MEQIAELTGVAFRAASPTELAKLEALDPPQSVIDFCSSFEPAERPEMSFAFGRSSISWRRTRRCHSEKGSEMPKGMIEAARSEQFAESHPDPFTFTHDLHFMLLVARAEAPRASHLARRRSCQNRKLFLNRP